MRQLYFFDEEDPWKIRLSDCIPFQGWDTYRTRNNLGGGEGNHEPNKDSRAVIRDTGLTIYNFFLPFIVIGTSLGLAEIIKSSF